MIIAVLSNYMQRVPSPRRAHAARKNYLRMKKYFIVLFASLNLLSCNKFLDELPRTKTDVNTFFSSQADFELAINGAYAALRNVYGSKSAWIMGEMRSDNTHYDYKASDQAIVVVDRYNVANFTDDQYNSQTAAKWNTAYNAISAANNILDHINDISFNSKDYVEGQARFIRALCYFELVRYYGGVPLYTSQARSREDTYLGRSTVEEVYALIEADLTDAGLKLPLPTFPQNAKATKGAAFTLLADVYITQKKFAAAEPLLKQVTEMNYSLWSNYSDVFELANKNGKESIFEIQYDANLATPQASNFIYNFIPRMTSSAVITGPSQNTITDLGGFNTPTSDLINTYEGGDKRLDASIAIAEGTFDNNDTFTATALNSIVNYTAPPGKIGRPFIKKYLHPHTIANQTNDNWPVYRYAETLLLLAESLNEQGKSNEALAYLNQVRTRAGLASLTVSDVEALREAIRRERRVELAFENKRWLDLVRAGKAISVMSVYGTLQKQQYSYLTPETYNVTENRLLFPVPYAEMQLNMKLSGQQNPGY